ncbi:hypothetical protein [Hartmannibacter diazotrophicus]|uniref:hypothetical protein n=1 Tax=Hartmannibacter diazotrophicus TaxID=1482074 RepID=UPI0012FDF452|nr:hypothetical protein [Hartmannibacter diazotrophicus]
MGAAGAMVMVFLELACDPRNRQASFPAFHKGLENNVFAGRAPAGCLFGGGFTGARGQTLPGAWEKTAVPAAQAIALSGDRFAGSRLVLLEGRRMPCRRVEEREPFSLGLAHLSGSAFGA